MSCAPVAPSKRVVDTTTTASTRDRIAAVKSSRIWFPQSINPIGYMRESLSHAWIRSIPVITSSPMSLPSTSSPEEESLPR